MESIYEICFYGGLMLAILLLVVSVVLFITLKIPKVFGELTGRSAKKSIKEMKEGTPVKNSISKKEQAKYYNQGSGKIKVRDAVSPEKRKANRDDTTDALRPKTEKNLRKKTRVLYENTAEIPEKETDVLASESQETMNEEETNVLSAVTEEETAVLSEKEEETAVLAGDEGEETAVLAGDEDEATDVLASDEGEETAVLASDEGEETAVLTNEDESEETVVLASDGEEEETSVLRAEDADLDDEGATTVLSGKGKNNKMSRKYKIEYSVILIHTDETL